MCCVVFICFISIGLINLTAICEIKKINYWNHRRNHHHRFPTIIQIAFSILVFFLFKYGGFPLSFTSECVLTFGGKLSYRSFQIDLFLCVVCVCANSLLSLVAHSLSHSRARINRAICLKSRVNFFCFVFLSLSFCVFHFVWHSNKCVMYTFLLLASVIIICGFGTSSILHFATPSLFIYCVFNSVLFSLFMSSSF